MAINSEMKQYLLNSSVLTSFGEWKYEILSVDSARKLASQGSWISAIGHAAAAESLSQLLGIHVELQRIEIEMQVGDRAIVLRFSSRLKHSTDLSIEQAGQLSWQLGLLTRTE